eukprot:359956-Chlamydomonas_euryale.AAC.3
MVLRARSGSARHRVRKRKCSSLHLIPCLHLPAARCVPPAQLGLIAAILPPLGRARRSPPLIRGAAAASQLHR